MGRIENRTLNERAYDEIKRSLIAGHFRPGDVLVTRTLAETYGISTTPVREALQRLVGERQLVLLPNRSVAVPAWDVEKYLELARIRRELEGLAAELAAENITEKILRVLEKILLDIEKSILDKDISAYVNLNQQFHFVIYACANSPRLLQMIQDVWGQVGPYFLELFSDPGYEAVANTEHVLILESLRARDGASVRKHIVADIAGAAGVLEPRIQELASKDDRARAG